MRTGEMKRCRADAIVAHTWYLFTYGSQQRGNRHDFSQLLVAWRKSQASATDVRYLDSVERGFLMSEYFPADGSVCDFVSRQYLSHGDAGLRADWLAWLKRHLKFKTILRLANASDHISREYAYIIDNEPSTKWLALLLDFWTEYSPMLRGQLLRALSTQSVSCEQGASCVALNTTYLPVSAIVEDQIVSQYLVFLDIHDPDDKKWQRLSLLGVGIHLGLKCYLDCLYNASVANKSGDESLSVDELYYFYGKIEHFFSEDVELARNMFRAYQLVGLPDTCGTIEWCSPGECRWEAPTCLRRIQQLALHYAGLHVLFTEHLMIESAGLPDVIDEMKHLDDSEGEYDRSRQLLLVLSRYAPFHTMHRKHLKRLGTISAFPIRSGSATKVASIRRHYWHIADREKLYDCFAGHVWLLDFTVEQCAALKPLIDYLDLADRLLTQAIEIETTTSGEQSYEPDLTRSMQAKAKFIVMLVEGEQRSAVESELSGIQVWTATKLLLRRSVRQGDHVHFGRNDRGRVVLEEQDGQLRLFISDDNVGSDTIPWHFIGQELKAHLSLDDRQSTALAAILTTSDSSQIQEILEETFTSVTSDVRTHVEQHSDSLDDSDDSPDDRAPWASAGEEATEESFAARVPRSNRHRGRLLHSTSSAGSIAQVSITDRDLEQAAAGLSISDVDVIDATPAEAADQTTSNRRASQATSQSLIRASSSLATTMLLESNHLAPRRSSGRGSFRSSTGPLTGSGASTRRPGDLEKEIGFKGEYFIYRVLCERFAATESCWTSAMRSRAGLPPFRGDEGAQSDITVTDHTIATSIWRWLVSDSDSSGPTTIHIEVKSTVEDCTEPFMMSNNQLRLVRPALTQALGTLDDLAQAKQWHDAPDHLYAIFRVYNLERSPAFRVYADPFALVLDGTLSMTAQGGYCVVLA
ncbi:hypothetical protein LTR56_014313 [Elasticomyces elasticus]|nr:hypothetical protein LTR22_024713 [Elasticomyces elasticus]KAK3636150.1 hypothetical protein LTR56_014313 [Elasticomyces elasticus]KAK4916569.1 hypothetical protein LTR49_015402 [Elasticomyces elasticus]